MNSYTFEQQCALAVMDAPPASSFRKPPMAAVKGRTPFRDPMGFLGKSVCMGDVVVVTSAFRDEVLAGIDATNLKATAVQTFYAANQYNLPTLLGAQLGTWNNYWSLADQNQPAVFNLYEKFTGDKNAGLVSTWSSQEEGAYSGWKYAVEQLYALANNPPTPAPTPTPTPTPAPTPGPGPTPTPAAGGTSPWIYVAGAVVGLGILGGVGYAISR